MGSFRHPRSRDFAPKFDFQLTAKVFGAFSMGSFGFVSRTVSTARLIETLAADGEFWGIPGNERGRIGSFRKFSETSPAYSVVKEHISLLRPKRVRV